MKGHMEKDGFHPHKTYKGVRKSRNLKTKTQGVRMKKDLPKKLTKEEIKVIREGFDNEFGDIELDHYNPKYKLYEVYVDADRYYMFPDEDSAIKFGRQSIRDTATEYIPDKGTENYDEWVGLSEDDLVDKIIEEQGGYGGSSELSAIAKSVASYDGEYGELSNGWIIFRID